jgi:hypothetical protein
MARFVTFANSVTLAGSSDPVGMRDMSNADDRGMLQIDSLLGNPFEVRVFATAVFSFGGNTGGPWHDITDRFKNTSAQDADFVQVGGVWQKKKDTTLGLPLTDQGIYALEPGLFPAAIFAGIITAPTSGHLDLHFGF